MAPSFTASSLQRRFALLTLLAGLSATGAAPAQETPSEAAKSVAAEPVMAYPTFDRWATGTGAGAGDVTFTVVTTTIRDVSLQSNAAPSATYEPQPVIIGQPELPLVGASAADAARRWDSALNYQGMRLSLLVLDARGRQREQRAMSTDLNSGERFKIRVVSTFDAVAEVEQVVGDVWYGQRAGQVYPSPGSSVSLRAGETVDLPLEPNDYFVMNSSGNRRFVLSVRHARASGESRSTQPAYRVDSSRSSSYLQLVPRGQYPAVEQLIARSR